MADFDNITNGVGIVSGALAVSGGDEITAAIGAVCAAVCAAGYIIKIAARLIKWLVGLRRLMKSGATLDEIEAHCDALAEIAEEMEGKTDEDVERK